MRLRKTFGRWMLNAMTKRVVGYPSSMGQMIKGYEILNEGGESKNWLRKGRRENVWDEIESNKALQHKEPWN
jgi:hypothetical protein